MITKSMKILCKEKLTNIKIQENLKKHPPKADKMMCKWIFYTKHGMFSQPIVVDKDNYLIDGYTTYIMAKALKKKYMTVKRV